MKHLRIVEIKEGDGPIVFNIEYWHEGWFNKEWRTYKQRHCPCPHSAECWVDVAYDTRLEAEEFIDKRRPQRQAN